MNFYNSFVLFCLLIYLYLNKQTVKTFYDNILYSPLRELYSAKIDLRLINFRQNLRGICAFSWGTPTLVMLLQRI